MVGDEGVGKSSESASQPLGSPAAGSSRPVFISYASHDAELAQKVCSALEAANFPCWIAPRNVVPGTMYADGIVRAIDGSSILVLILSEQAIASAHVGREIERAVSKRHPVVALRIDGAPLTGAFEYFLNQSQWIEGGGSDAAIAQLVSAVRQHLSPETAPSPTDASQAAAVHRKAPARRRQWVIGAVLVGVTLMAAYFFVDKTRRATHESTETAVVGDKSIAVLPFVDMSEKKDQEYFADGMAEEIIDLLVKIPGLKVISRTSSFQFKGKTEDLRSIATQLGVAYVLEGSVRKSGERLRVTAQLIDSRDGTHLWSQAYDRDLSDVLRMQDEIALALVRALQIEVGTGEFPGRPVLRNAEAYTLYLQGQHADDRGDQQGLEQAIRDFQRGLELDPTFAAAEVGLGASYSDLGVYGLMPPASAFEKAREAAERAVRLDPKLAIAHVLLSDIYRLYDWDWASAGREMEQARTLAPNDSNVFLESAALAATFGRWDESLAQVNAALAQDPLNPAGYFALGAAQLRRGRLAEAEAAQRRALAISPTGTGGHYFLGLVLLARSQHEAALAEMLKESDDQMRLGGSAMAFFALGRKVDSDAALASMIKSEAHRPFFIACVHAFRGEPDEALKWLEAAYTKRETALLLLKGQLMFDKFEGDPRYKAFLKKMNVPG